jgi:hypothetical protein
MADGSRINPVRRPVPCRYDAAVPGHPVVKQSAEHWRARAGDPEFQEVRRAAQRIDAEYRKSTPWWGRCDLDDAHIFRAAGRPVLIDVFCMAGTDLYRAILEDVAEVHRRMPRERMRYALDIPYIARENSTAEIGLFLSWQLTHLPISELPWPGAGGSC